MDDHPLNSQPIPEADRHSEDQRVTSQINPLWQLHDHLTVQQAAALIGGHDPAEVKVWGVGSDSSIYAPLSALMNAINGGSLAARKQNIAFTNWNSEYECMVKDEQDELDPAQTTIARTDLIAWLRARGFRSGFFFPDPDQGQDYLDPQHPRYAPKLAAAVKAWQATTTAGKSSPKKALEKWLREHAAEFGLTDDEGNPINQAIEDCSKVANWQMSGGAPSSSNQTS